MSLRAVALNPCVICLSVYRGLGITCLLHDTNP